MKKFLPLVNNVLKRKLTTDVAKEQLFFVLLITFLVAVWFRKGLVIASGESGLPFYYPHSLLENPSFNWSDTPFGDTGGVGYASLPLYIVLNFLHNLGIPLFLVQAFIYWLVLVVGVLSIHKISSWLSDQSLVRITAGLFYLFNPVVHVLVLHRVQYSMTFFYGFMPIAFLLFYDGIINKKWINIILINLIGLIFSSVFVGLPFLELLFLSFGLLVLFIALPNFLKKRWDFFPIIYLMGFLLSFVLVNIWWIMPLFSTFFISAESSGGALAFFDSNNNVLTFHSISEQLQSIISVFRLVPANFYDGNGSTWGWIYTVIPYVILSFVFIITFILSLLRPVKHILYRFFIVLSLLLMFFMKGDLPPFGEISTELIKHFAILQVYRNPFEKLSIMLPFAMAIPVGLGMKLLLDVISSRVAIRFKRLVIAIIIILIFPVYMFPLVNGYAFTGGGAPADDLSIGQYVKVPEYYSEAREWLNSQQQPFRVLALPINGEGMTYKWEYGYSGVELSNTLFDQPFISYSTSQKFLPDLIYALQNYLHTDPSKFVSLAQFFNIRYIMIRDDIDYKARAIDSPQASEELVKTKLADSFKLAVTFGKLKFYEIDSTRYTPRVYAKTVPIIGESNKEGGLGLLPFLNIDDKDLIIYPTESQKISEGQVRNNGIEGARVENLEYLNKGVSSDLPLIRFSPLSPIYKLILAKEEFDLGVLGNNLRPSYRAYLLEKRLAEMKQFNLFNKPNLELYLNGLSQLSDEFFRYNPTDQDVASKIIKQKRFFESIKIPESDENKLVQEAISKIDQFLVKSKYRPVYPTQKQMVQRFELKKPQQYEILLSKKSWDSYYHKSEFLEFDLDGTKRIANLNNQDGDLIILGKYDLDAGVHEIAFNQPELINLVDHSAGELEISSGTKSNQKLLPLKSFDYDSVFQISFEYIAEKGSDPIVGVIQDTDSIDKQGLIQPRVINVLARDNYERSWRKHQMFFQISPNTQQASVFFMAMPWGDCKTSVKRSYQKYCEDEAFEEKFLKESVIKFKNIKVDKVFNNTIVLRGEEKLDKVTSPNVEFKQISPAQYIAKISNASQPFFLNLSTTYDSRWRAYVGPESIEIDPKNHILSNGFSNSWFINKTGDFEVKLEFYPDRYYQMSKKLSTGIAGIYLFVFGSYLIINHRKK